MIAFIIITAMMAKPSSHSSKKKESPAATVSNKTKGLTNWLISILKGLILLLDSILLYPANSSLRAASADDNPLSGLT